MVRTAAVFCFVFLASAGTSRAGLILTFSQSGANVVAQASGTLDVASLTLAGHGSSGGFLTPGLGSVGVGDFTTNNLYQGYTGPTSFGTGAIILASSTTGDVVGIEGSGDKFLITPNNYTSGASLSGTATWNNATISGLGLTPGNYTWTWGTGPTADSFEVIIPGASVPEPSGVGLATGLVGLRAWTRRRRTPATA